jgi:hypothetical protein
VIKVCRGELLAPKPKEPTKKLPEHSTSAGYNFFLSKILLKISSLQRRDKNYFFKLRFEILSNLSLHPQLKRDRLRDSSNCLLFNLPVLAGSKFFSK